MKTPPDIDWQKEAIAIFVNLYPIKKERSVSIIFKEVVSLVIKHSHGTAAAIVSQEDPITARVLHSSDNFVSGFLPANMILGIIEENSIVVRSADCLLTEN